MEEQNPLDKKKRCPKGQVRNKEGVCVEKPKKDEADKPEPMLKEPKVKEPKVKEPKVKEPKVKAPKTKTSKKITTSLNKTLKKLTKVQAVKILADRRTCIQAFRNKL